MTIKASGQLSFDNDIEAEFGENPSRSLGSYRNTHPDFKNKNCGSLTDLPLDEGIPKEGEIKFSHFYGKKLNIVVDYYSDSENRQDSGASSMAATARYVSNNAKVKIVGDYQTKPTAILNSGTYNLTNATTNASWQGGKKVFINVNAQIGGIKATSQAHRNRVALRTGGWPSGTTLQIDIGPSGRLQGGGGDGRKGGGSTPAKALPGTSALGVEYAAHINKDGIIRCGYGGGGGGGGSSSNPGKSSTDYGRSAGAGGGGAGIPAGTGGPQGAPGYDGDSPSNNVGQAGQDGTFDAGGNPGPYTPPNNDKAAGGFGVGADHGGNSSGGVKAGNGGRGGDKNDPVATGGTAGVRQGGGTTAHAGGAGGDNGFGIIFGNSSIESASTGFKSTPNNEGGDTSSGGIY